MAKAFIDDAVVYLPIVWDVVQNKLDELAEASEYLISEFNNKDSRE